MTRPAIPFAKGHGTGNDFVILTDLDAQLELTATRSGACATGGMASARTACWSSPARPPAAEVPDQSGAEFFMDYRNADGTMAEMCGNGARVFVAHLIEAGLDGAG